MKILLDWRSLFIESTIIQIYPIDHQIQDNESRVLKAMPHKKFFP